MRTSAFITLKLLLVFLFLQIEKTNAANQYGFYSINVTTNHLVLIDTSGTVKDIGPTGVHFVKYFTSLAFYKDSLYCFAFDTFYTVDKSSGHMTKLFALQDSDGYNFGMGRLLIDSKGQFYIFGERTQYAEGILYHLNTKEGTATPVSSGTSGNPSIVGIAFDKNDSLYAASEATDNLLKMNPATGAVDYSYSNLLGMDFTTALGFAPSGKLWGIDITQEDTIPAVKLCTIDILSGQSTVQFQLNNNYCALAWGAYESKTAGILAEENNLMVPEVYPNPNQGQFTISLQGNPGEINFTVTDLVGRIIPAEFTRNGNRYGCSLGANSGLYIVTGSKNSVPVYRSSVMIR